MLEAVNQRYITKTVKGPSNTASEKTVTDENFNMLPSHLAHGHEDLECPTSSNKNPGPRFQRKDSVRNKLNHILPEGTIAIQVLPPSQPSSQFHLEPSTSEGYLELFSEL